VTRSAPETATEAPDPPRPLRAGWTTGACATAATKAAFTALLTGEFPDPVEIVLPRGQGVAFALALEEAGEGFARAGIVKDAGDDPDVTHGATIVATVRPAARGIMFRAGEGVGIVTKAGLPVAVGEPAINPVPRTMMRKAIEEVAATYGAPAAAEIEISVPGGARLAERTWNPRLGILGGLSILGTTGIVHPFSCSAWIHSIHSGIDVARAEGLAHIAGATGSTSEAAAKAHFGLPDYALIDMGDFAGGMLKYLRAHPVPRVTIAGGFAKMTKLAQGALDLHSGRSQVDFDWLAACLADAGANAGLVAAARDANTAAEVAALAAGAGVPLASLVSDRARASASAVLRGAPVALGVMIVGRDGAITAHAEPAARPDV
jgi:cobalt-precorrin-5B (C1)-methyltransferase